MFYTDIKIPREIDEKEAAASFWVGYRVVAEVDRALVALLDFKSSAPSEQGGRWVRFPCTSAKTPSLDRPQP